MRRLIVGLIAAAVSWPIVPALVVARPRTAGQFVTPKSPAAMAESASGVLYVVDAGRDQILREVAGGRFMVVAGNGRRGFSGDGHRAITAEISVRAQSGLAVARDGTVFFADSGNGRVREILPNGVIETVAGGGTRSPRRAPVVAVRARFASDDELNGLAVGPNGELYVAADGVYRLDGGVLRWVVGSDAAGLNRRFRGFGMNPATQKDFDPADTLAFDGRGDLLVGGGETWGLYEVTTSGSLRYLQNDRGEPGVYRAMATEPNGNVVLAGGINGFDLFHPSGRITWIAAPGLSKLISPNNTFAVGEGTATAPDGAVFLDTQANNGFSGVNAIAKVTPTGHEELIWKS